MSKSMLYCAPANSCFSLPLHQTERAPLVGDGVIAASVLCLLGLFQPSTVARLIVTVVVDAVNFVRRRWSLPHIRKEVLKRILPAVANRNAACAVSFVCFFVLVQAPAFNSAPDFVFGGFRQAVGLPAAYGVPSAAAAFCKPLDEARSPDSRLSSALTLAKPLAAFDKRECCKSAKYFPGEIVTRGRLDKISGSHNASSIGKWSEPPSCFSTPRGSFILANGGVR